MVIGSFAIISYQSVLGFVPVCRIACPLFIEIDLFYKLFEAWDSSNCVLKRVERLFSGIGHCITFLLVKNIFILYYYHSVLKA